MRDLSEISAVRLNSVKIPCQARDDKENVQDDKELNEFFFKFQPIAGILHLLITVFLLPVSQVHGTQAGEAPYQYDDDDTPVRCVEKKVLHRMFRTYRTVQ
jgi:hypothetical protein